MLAASTLPLSKPHSTRSPAITGRAVPRSDRRGTCCSWDHSSWPSAGLRAWSLPSTVRTAISRSEMAAGASSSPLRRTFQSIAPLAALKANNCPSLEPTNTNAALAAVPPASGARVCARHSTRPEARSKATRSPR